MFLAMLMSTLTPFRNCPVWSGLLQVLRGETETSRGRQRCSDARQRCSDAAREARQERRSAPSCDQLCVVRKGKLVVALLQRVGQGREANGNVVVELVVRKLERGAATESEVSDVTGDISPPPTPPTHTHTKTAVSLHHGHAMSRTHLGLQDLQSPVHILQLSLVRLPRVARQRSGSRWSGGERERAAAQARKGGSGEAGWAYRGGVLLTRLEGGVEVGHERLKLRG